MTERPRDDRDLRDVPNYTVVESARWLGLPTKTLRVWLVGPGNQTKIDKRYLRTVVRPASTHPLGLSFWNLVECFVLASIRKAGKISLPEVHRLLAIVCRELGRERPLIDREFANGGVRVVVEYYGKLLAATAWQETTMLDFLHASLKRIQHDETGLAKRLFPWRRQPFEPRVVSVDPRLCFGRPVLASTRITADELFERLDAGETIEQLAHDHQVGQDRIEALVRCWGGATALSSDAYRGEEKES